MGSSKSKQNITWVGRLWRQGKNHPFKIEHMDIDLSGRITGHGKNRFGRYTINGVVTKAGVATFKFNHKSKPGPTFEAKVHSGCLIGLYTIDGISNAFGLRLKSFRKFHGEYTRKDLKKPQQVVWHMDIHKTRIFGFGRDYIGPFVINGEGFKKKDVKFRLSYIGQYSVEHKGDLEFVKQAKAYKATGRWRLLGGGGFDGRFQVSECLIPDDKAGRKLADLSLAKKIQMLNVKPETFRRRRSVVAHNQRASGGVGGGAGGRSFKSETFDCTRVQMEANEGLRQFTAALDIDEATKQQENSNQAAHGLGGFGSNQKPGQPAPGAPRNPQDFFNGGLPPQNGGVENFGYEENLEFAPRNQQPQNLTWANQRPPAKFTNQTGPVIGMREEEKREKAKNGVDHQNPHNFAYPTN